MDYNDELELKYGNTKEFKEYKSKNYKKEDFKRFEEEQKIIFEKFAHLMNNNSTNFEIYKQIEIWQNYITNNFYHCDDNMLKSLADTYITDDRFKENIDKYNNGLTSFLNQKIYEYLEQK